MLELFGIAKNLSLSLGDVGGDGGVTDRATIALEIPGPGVRPRAVLPPIRHPPVLRLLTFEFCFLSYSF